MSEEKKKKYNPLSSWAKECFKKYENRPYKIAKETPDSIMFVDANSDLSTADKFAETCLFCFWIDKAELEVNDER